MFTGIVTAIGEIASADKDEHGLELVISCSYRDLEAGESIAVDGACLTATACGPGWFRVHAMGPTLERTGFGHCRPGQRVNLERAVRAGDRLGGHLVQGHVDGLGTVRRVTQRDDARLLDIAAPAEVTAVTIPLGSITVDGVSLTVNAIPEPGVIQVALIPHTLEQTTLRYRQVGDQVHLEGDTVGKYVRALLGPSGIGTA